MRKLRFSLGSVKRIALFLTMLGSFGLLFLAGSHLYISAAGKGRIFDSIASVPARDVGLVLGTSPAGSLGPNRYFEHRMDAASHLFHAGKCRFLLLSGDNSRREYDEPDAMYQALEKRGVPGNRMILDCAGFRTLDSVVRAKDVFGATEILVVSQAFHNQRAVFLARAHGLDAVGFNAQDVGRRAGFKTRLREVAARAVAVLDISVLRRQPKFLGPEIAISEANAGRVNLKH